MEKCWRCGKELICSGNFMLSDFSDEPLEDDDDSLMTHYDCPYCGAEYVITDTPNSEKRNYPYFKNRNDI